MATWTETKRTGKQRHRVNWRGLMILQVEVEQVFQGNDCPYTASPHYANGRTRLTWRDAVSTDLS